MSAPQTDGPFAQWRSLLTTGPTNAMKQWEGWLGQQLDKFVRSETFLERMGKAMEGSFQFKAAMDRAMDASLRNLRVPPMGDLLDVFKRLDAVERGIDQLGRRFEDVNARLDALAAGQAQVLAALQALAGQAAPAEAESQTTESQPADTKAAESKTAARKPRAAGEASK
jgi:hypothetical protein